jgi:hypothetical protein
MKKLVDQLEGAGVRAIALYGGRIVVSEFGGRILGLLPDGETNLFWVNPDTVAQIDQWRRGEGWSNLGGERVWLSPEIDVNVPDPERMMESYAVPPAMDPGQFALREAPGGISLVNELELTWQRTRQRLAFEVERIIRPLENSPVDLSGGVSFTGYELTSKLTSRAPLESARPGLWNLIQVPGGGSVRTSVRPGANPVSVINEARWTIEDRLLTTEGRTKTSFKWSLHASDAGGRFLYHRDLGDGRASLVVRDFPVGEDRDYSDCPCHTPEDTGHMCQVYVDDGGLGGFAELEFHTPALAAGVRESLESSCTALGFTGPADAVRDLCVSLAD